MFAIIESGGKQYRAEVGKKLRLEKLDLKDGATAVFSRVLLRHDGKETEIGAPFLKDAEVKTKVLRSGKDKKKIIFRYHSKTRYRRKKGHRQPFTEVEILKIS